MRKGFTLIELLIVIAIIAILALIAIPNFLEAQTRSKVARVMADMRSVAVGIEAYYVDNNEYPLCFRRPANDWGSGTIQDAYSLSTPIAYLTSVSFKDPFRTTAKGTDADPLFLEYSNIRYWRWSYNSQKLPLSNRSDWVLCSLGPDQLKGPDPYGVISAWWIAYYGLVLKEDARYAGKNASFVAFKYDPSNGTVSRGDVLRWQKEEDR